MTGSCRKSAVFPAIDIAKSGTRREEALLSGSELSAVWAVRKAMSSRNTVDVTEEILNKAYADAHERGLCAEYFRYDGKIAEDNSDGTETGNLFG